MIKVASIGFIVLGLMSSVHGQSVQRERPAEWDHLVYGGQFKDILQAMPILSPLTSDTWGGENVLPRDVTNGIESPEWSYWGGNAILGKDGMYHLYVCRWAENSPEGHFQYHDSEVVPPLKPFEKTVFELDLSKVLEKGRKLNVTVRTACEGQQPELLTQQVQF